MTRPAIDPRFDRLCEDLAEQRRHDVAWAVDHRRGSLDLDKDGAQHRKYHSLYDDLLN